MSPYFRSGALLTALFYCGALQQSVQTKVRNDNAGVVTVSDTADRTTTPSWRSNTPGSCESRTINSLTHVLPQQCLRTDRSTVRLAPVHSISKAISEHNDITTSHKPSQIAAPDLLALQANLTDRTHDNAATTEVKSVWETSEVATASAAISSSATAVDISKGDEADADSILDPAQFLSFEEWKKQNLAKAGQSPDHVGQRLGTADGAKRRPSVNEALEGLGEENEIDIDFGFASTRPSLTKTVAKASLADGDDTAATPSPSGSSILRSKDAGKTCKERTNYASFDCAATIVKNNPECKSASSILVEHKDSYMLNICSARNKFIIVELCDDILVDTVVLANYEFFSSIFRHFRVSVSDRYPAKAEKWRDLGTFEARGTREIQAFLVENPLIWARYLRIEFLTHYGNEYYCPLSLLRVHGTTMMEEYKNQDELSREESSEEVSTSVETKIADASPIVPSAAGQTSVNQPDERDNVDSQARDGRNIQKMQTVSPHTLGEQKASNQIQPSLDSSGLEDSRPGGNYSATITSHHVTSPMVSASSTATEQSLIVVTPMDDHKIPVTTADEGSKTHMSRDVTPKKSEDTMIRPEKSVNDSSTASTNTTLIDPKEAMSKDLNRNISQSVTGPALKSTTKSTINTSTIEPVDPSKAVHSSSSKPSSQTVKVNSTRNPERSSTGSAQPQPTTQESFFKTVHKRLQQLESNSTLSLQYIEEQSRLLRDAFSKVEKRQSTNMLAFLTKLNGTVMSELGAYRQAYDQLWQSTVLELESHRDQYQHEMFVLSTRLTMVADELLWQKRVGIVQSTLLILALGLVLFTRQGQGHIEIPVLQHVRNRSRGKAVNAWDSDSSPSLASPSPTKSHLSQSWRDHTTTELISDESDAEGDVGHPRNHEVSVHVSPPSPPLSIQDENVISLDHGTVPTEELSHQAGGQAEEFNNALMQDM